ncbi:membrane protein [Mycobacteroides abscessus subsp. abscessus]|uniref:MspA family porin n=1 Tax=Mycobacteroides abscessus TaxID=36809 RepID=UPI0009275F13|nr:MspA family porin [Mycobacteroides abscessus]MDO3217942.1 MspA family porin [Mycobacteroides abscessus subsp. abscessus]SHS93547.1 MspA protein [Mycobacteroides abscessus subsp. abscessus]SHT57516.1 membrane protein [Mycobacteroides abscessus subsp. abscessus]SHW44103.1 membrane protein [Mycobacteroides abscessus subsp. abscessus]SIF80465.1 membrane protein [Mycobacteroides abscessus subsp. abscessus]
MSERILEAAGRVAGRLVTLVSMTLALIFAVNFIAHADGLPDSTESDITEDGWGIQVGTLDEDVNSVPNLAATPFTREAFVQVTGFGKITGKGRFPVTAANLILGYQMGCQSDISKGVDLGGNLGAGPALNGTTAGDGSVGGSLARSIGGSLAFSLRPGGIIAIPMDSIALKGDEARLRVRNIHVKIDACNGSVTIRSFAIMNITSDFSHSSLATYGIPIQI